MGDNRSFFEGFSSIVGYMKSTGDAELVQRNFEFHLNEIENHAVEMAKQLLDISLTKDEQRLRAMLLVSLCNAWGVSPQLLTSLHDQLVVGSQVIAQEQEDVKEEELIGKEPEQPSPWDVFRSNVIKACLWSDEQFDNVDPRILWAWSFAVLEVTKHVLSVPHTSFYKVSSDIVQRAVNQCDVLNKAMVDWQKEQDEK